MKYRSCREICERHHGSPIEGSLGTPHISLHYGIKGPNGSPNLVPLCEEAQATRAAE